MNSFAARFDPNCGSRGLVNLLRVVDSSKHFLLLRHLNFDGRICRLKYGIFKTMLLICKTERPQIWRLWLEKVNLSQLKQIPFRDRQSHMTDVLAITLHRFRLHRLHCEWLERCLECLLEFIHSWGILLGNQAVELLLWAHILCDIVPVHEWGWRLPILRRSLKLVIYTTHRARAWWECRYRWRPARLYLLLVWKRWHLYLHHWRAWQSIEGHGYLCVHILNLSSRQNVLKGVMKAHFAI